MEIKTTSRTEIKLMLKRAGFYNGVIDGEATMEFTDAVAKAQEAIGTFADGLWGPATEKLLEDYIKRNNL